MLTTEEIQGIIFQALNDVNQEREPADRLEIGLDTRLFGADAVLDSLSMVSVIVDVEAGVSARCGRDISLTDDQAMSQEVSPFTDVRALTAYILQLLAPAA